jgi:predicted 3-demethylubiquinone-9 3-methyltransferase (glyoxalase superfamily)
MYSDFRLGDTWFAAMDSAHEHKFAFNEAISFLVPCRDQAEIERHWAKLSSDPKSEQCGWCKDRYGVSWQVTPIAMDEIMASGDQATIDRVVQALMPMHKIDLAALEAAARGK